MTALAGSLAALPWEIQSTTPKLPSTTDLVRPAASSRAVSLQRAAWIQSRTAIHLRPRATTRSCVAAMMFWVAPTQQPSTTSQSRQLTPRRRLASMPSVGAPSRLHRISTQSRLSLLPADVYSNIEAVQTQPRSRTRSMPTWTMARACMLSAVAWTQRRSTMIRLPLCPKVVSLRERVVQTAPPSTMRPTSTSPWRARART